MKTFLTLALILSVHISFISAHTVLNGPEKPAPIKNSWVKSEKGIWLGNYNTRYKIDKKNNAVKCSVNGTRWKKASDAVWQDQQGRWFCMYEGKLMCNSDGKNWTEVPDNKWQDLTGKWYRFDSATRELEEPAL